MKSPIAIALLMVSPFPYYSFKNIKIVHPYRALVLFVLALVFIVMTYKVSLFAVGLCYVASGPVEWLWRRQTGRQLTMQSSQPTPAPAETGSGAHP